MNYLVIVHNKSMFTFDIDKIRELYSTNNFYKSIVGDIISNPKNFITTFDNEMVKRPRFSSSRYVLVVFPDMYDKKIIGNFTANSIMELFPSKHDVKIRTYTHVMDFVNNSYNYVNRELKSVLTTSKLYKLVNELV